MFRVSRILALALILGGGLSDANAQQCSAAELAVDVHNCGSCGNDCTANSLNANFACNDGQCANLGCRAGFYDLNGDGRCEYACTFRSATELCNNLDDDCDGLVDENITPPSTQSICGVSPHATSAECNAQVTRACVNGAWQCGFPANVCLGGNCATTAETCDALDNNCNGLLNENVPSYGRACNSDDGQAPPGHGRCRTQGTFVCNGPNAVMCNAVQASCASLPGGCDEVCDGIDNDCDQLVDETFNARGPNSAFFVKPAVTKIAASTWIYQYEASRPAASGATQGQGNGYFTSPPAGETYDKTRACSKPGALPWTNVTPREVEQICTAMGGRICTGAEAQSACAITQPCKWGYAPRGTACALPAVLGSKFCNLGVSLDTNSAVPGDQDGLLVTASGLAQNCWADWSGLFGNTAATNKIFDITGNVREIAKLGTNVYALLGGSTLNAIEDGAQCANTQYTGDASYRYRDAGFRCCFDSDPTQ